jgi:WD40 repeat protein
MSDPGVSDEDLALSEWVDEVADRFEAAWRELTPPAIADFLRDVTGERGVALRAELEKIDRAYRGKLGVKSPAPAVQTPTDSLASHPTLAMGTDGPDLPGYEILGELGRGGMGVVYKARQKGLPRLVAVKMLPAGAVAAGPQQRRFRAEAEAVARLQHPNIVHIYEVGQHAGRPFFALEYVAGGSLAQRLYGRPQPARVAARLVEVLARAVHFAHQHQIVHRDLKPSNVLVAEGPEVPLDRCTPKISDFGLAKELDGAGANGQTRTGEILGTPSYMAPEQASGKVKEVGQAADVYALGAILYELLTGRPPFKGESTLDTLEQVRSQDPIPPRRLQPKASRDLETVCLKCLAKSPGRRYADAQELADDLQRFLDGRPIRARPFGRPEKVWRWCRRNPAVACLTALVALLLVGLTAASLGVAVTARGREEEARRREQEATVRERDRRRETLVQSIQLLRSGEPRAGWSEKAWGLVREAVALGGEDPEGRLRDEAASTLAGLDGRLLKEFHSPNRYEDDASWAAFSPDGKRLLLGGANAGPGQAPRPARIWDRATDTAVTSRQAGPGPVVFRRDGTPLQMVPRDTPATLLVWDVDRQRPVGECRFAGEPSPAALLRNGHRLPVAAVSADARRVAAAAGADSRGVVAVWDVASGQQLLQLAAIPHALALAPDGGLLAAGDRQGHVTVWSVPEGKLLADFQERLTVFSLAFSPDGRRLACGTEGGSLTVWDWLARRALCHCRGSGYDVAVVAFSPDGSLLASRAMGGLKIWDAATGTLLLNLIGGDYGAGLAFAPDGRTVANSSVSAFGPGAVFIHALENGRGIRTLHGLSTHVIVVAASRDGRLLAALTQDWKVAVWDRVNGRLRRVLDIPPGLTADNAALAFSPDGRRLAFAGGNAASLWDIATGKELRRWPLPPGLTDALAFDPTGARLLSFRYETEGGKVPPYGTDPHRHPRVCRIRDLLGVDALKPLAESRALDRHILSSRADPDGRRFYAHGLHGDGVRRRAVKAFDGLTGKVLWSLPGEGINAIDPTGKLLAVGLPSGMALVETASGKEVAAVRGGISSLAPEARYYGDWGEHNLTVSLRRLGEAAPLVTLHRQVPIRSHSLPFSPDGRFMTWGNADGTVSVCDLEEVRRRLAEVGLAW